MQIEKCKMKNESEFRLLHFAIFILQCAEGKGTNESQGISQKDLQ